MNINATIFLGKTPFLKLLPPFICGIILQWYLQLNFWVSVILLFVTIIIASVLFFSSLFQQFKNFWLQSIVLMIALAALGMDLVFINDIRHRSFWFGTQYRNAQTVIAVINENPIEKSKSYKAEARVDALITNHGKTNTTGNIVIYFKKDAISVLI